MTSEYKILELELPDELILKYLGVGNYEFEKEFTYNLAIEIAIPFDELQKLEQCSLCNAETLRLNNAKIYDKNENNITKILEYIQETSNYKSQDYIQIIEQILHILNFQINFGALYKNQNSSKSQLIQKNSHYKILLLNEFLKKIKKEIDKNMNQAIDYNLRKK